MQVCVKPQYQVAWGTAGAGYTFSGSRTSTATSLCCCSDLSKGRSSQPQRKCWAITAMLLSPSSKVLALCASEHAG